MKSRGYGLPKRTAFSLFRFTLRDGICLGVLATLGGIVLAGSLTGGLKWWYYPAPGGATRCAGCALDGGLRSTGRISPDL